MHVYFKIIISLAFLLCAVSSYSGEINEAGEKHKTNKYELRVYEGKVVRSTGDFVYAANEGDVCRVTLFFIGFQGIVIDIDPFQGDVTRYKEPLRSEHYTISGLWNLWSQLWFDYGYFNEKKTGFSLVVDEEYDLINKIVEHKAKVKFDDNLNKLIWDKKEVAKGFILTQQEDSLDIMSNREHNIRCELTYNESKSEVFSGIGQIRDRFNELRKR